MKSYSLEMASILGSHVFIMTECDLVVISLNRTNKFDRSFSSRCMIWYETLFWLPNHMLQCSSILTYHMVSYVGSILLFSSRIQGIGLPCRSGVLPPDVWNSTNFD